MPTNTKAELKRLLQERSLYPERAEEVDAQIYETFGVTRAILIMDMAGFSRSTIKYGLIHFLTMIHRMNEVAQPVIERNGGLLVKFEADNLFAVFVSVDQALDAAREIINCLEAANAVLSDDMDMRGKFGVGYGEILLVENKDLFGAEVNLASKLGENIALADEILLTKAARARSSARAEVFEAVQIEISGLRLQYYKLRQEQC
jgi:class 3 adenylate cyclase